MVIAVILMIIPHLFFIIVICHGCIKAHFSTTPLLRKTRKWVWYKDEEVVG